MKLYKISDKNKIYDDAIFIITDQEEIYSDSDALKMTYRNDMTIERLHKHIIKMLEEGFIITTTNI